MAKSAVLALKITGDASGARRALGQAEEKAGGFGSKLSKVGLVAGAAIGAVIAVGKAAFDSASNLQQQAGAVDAIFGKNAKKMHAYAAQAATTAGLATSEYDQLAAVLGSQLNAAGFAGDQLSGKVNNLIGMGSDLAAQFGGSTADAVEALSSVLKGETDPIERYGVSIKQSDINAVLAANHQSKLTGVALKNAQATAALGLVTKQTAKAHGQFAAQSNTAAERQQVFGAQVENLKAKLGQGLLPIFSGLVGFLSKRVLPSFDRLTRKGGPVSKMFAQVGAFAKKNLLPALTSLWNVVMTKVYPAWVRIAGTIGRVAVPAFKAIWSFVKSFVVPMFKTVMGPVISGVQKVWGSLAAALEKNRGKFSAIYEKLKPFLDFLKNKVAPVVGGTLKLAFQALGAVIGPVVDAITWLLGKAASVIGFIGKVGGFLFGGGSGGGGAHPGAPRSAVYGAAAGGGGVFAATRSLSGGTSSAAGGRGPVVGGPTVNITVNGALDPNAVARQIGQLLERYAVRTGGRVAVSR
jgi:hypothetical protein